jgi:hypothetical protein
MDIIASILAYLGSIIGIVAGLLMLGYISFASPRLPTFLPHTTVATQTQPTPHKAALSRLRKMARHRQLVSASRVDIRAGSQTNSAGDARYAVDRVPTTRRQKSHWLVSRDRVDTWAYHHEPSGFSRRANYAQELSGDSRNTW